MQSVCLGVLGVTLALPAAAVERERALDISAEFATHTWTMTAANQTATCSSSYESDYSPGTYVGVPYDWGGFYTTAEYDDYLEQGYGAGSHSWHDSLWCTVGVDCSGFVSQAWETSQKYGTSTFYQVTHDISVSDLKRADALNNAGSHIVLFAYESDAGLPIHYETYGTVVLVDSDQGWSSFDSYEAIRYDEIEDGPTTGTSSEPIEIEAFPYQDLRWTAGAASDRFDYYSCAPTTNESGPEMLYHFETPTGGSLHLTVSDDTGVDVDIHVLSELSEDACLSRNDSELTVSLEPGEYWIAADTYVSGYEFPGPYLLTASFTGEVGPIEDDDPSTAEGGFQPALDTGDWMADETILGGAPEADVRALPGSPNAAGCGCGVGAPISYAALLLPLIGLARRRTPPARPRRSQPLAPL